MKKKVDDRFGDLHFSPNNWTCCAEIWRKPNRDIQRHRKPFVLQPTCRVQVNQWNRNQHELQLKNVLFFVKIFVDIQRQTHNGPLARAKKNSKHNSFRINCGAGGYGALRTTSQTAVLFRVWLVTIYRLFKVFQPSPWIRFCQASCGVQFLREINAFLRAALFDDSPIRRLQVIRGSFMSCKFFRMIFEMEWERLTSRGTSVSVIANVSMRRDTSRPCIEIDTFRVSLIPSSHDERLFN